jgi:hypothetical protein
MWRCDSRIEGLKKFRDDRQQLNSSSCLGIVDVEGLVSMAGFLHAYDQLFDILSMCFFLATRYSSDCIANAYG